MINFDLIKKTKGVTLKFSTMPEIDGNYVKDFRKKYNLTQAKLAVVFNVTKKTVEKWEQSANKVNGSAQLLFFLYDEKPELMSSIISFEHPKNAFSQEIINESDLLIGDDYFTNEQLSNYTNKDVRISGKKIKLITN